MFSLGSGKMRLLAEKYKLDSRPGTESAVVRMQKYSRAYIRHLLKADERLGMRLCVLHNLWFYNELTANMRSSIENGGFEEFYHKYRSILGQFAED